MVLGWNHMAVRIWDVGSLVAVYSSFWSIVAILCAVVLLLLVVWAHWSITAKSLGSTAKSIEHGLLWSGAWPHWDLIFATIGPCRLAHDVGFGASVQSASLLLCSGLDTLVSVRCPRHVVLLDLTAIFVGVSCTLPSYLLRLSSHLHWPLSIADVQTIIEDARSLGVHLWFAADFDWPSSIQYYLVICSGVLLLNHIVIAIIQINDLSSFTLWCTSTFAKFDLLSMILSHLIVSNLTHGLRHRRPSVHPLIHSLIHVILVHISCSISEIEATVLFLWLLTNNLSLIKISTNNLSSAPWTFFPFGHFFLYLRT